MALRLALAITAILLALHYVDADGIEGRINGGRDANDNQFPYMVSLQMDGQWHMCGGSIVSTRWILTAARCVAGGGTSSLVRVGSVYRISGGSLYNIKRVVLHPNFNEQSANDIALVELTKPLTYTAKIQAIALAYSEPSVGSRVDIAGWGTTKQGGSQPNRLQWTSTTFLSRSDCIKLTNSADPSIICLGHGVDQGACSGDMGGPAVRNGELVGVAGLNYQCGTTTPDKYANVYHHRNWIKQYIN